MNPLAAAPTEESAAGDVARLLVKLLGPAHSAPDGSLNAADMLALGGALAAVRDTTLAALAEAFVTSASQLLAELEAAYGLPVRRDLGDDARQARLTAKVRAARAGTPQSIERALRAIDPAATVYENTPTTVPRDAVGERFVFYWSVRLTLAVWTDPASRAAIEALCEQMKPAHTDFGLHVNDPDVGFLFDVSGFDRDAFGSV